MSATRTTCADRPCWDIADHLCDDGGYRCEEHCVCVEEHEYVRDEEAITPICAVCGKPPVRCKGDR